MIPAGQHCTQPEVSTGTTDSDSDSRASEAANTNCTDTTVAHYTIAIGEQKLVIQPTLSGKAKAGAALSLGWSTAFAKNSYLYGQLPGAHIQIRPDGGGNYQGGQEGKPVHIGGCTVIESAFPEDKNCS